MQDYFIYKQITNSYITMKRRKEFLKTEIYNIENNNAEQSNEKLKELKAELNILTDEIKYFESNILDCL